MASSLIVPVVEIKNVRKHPNADKLELCNVLGYQMCIPKNKYKNGDILVYIPADTILPEEWAEKFGVRGFLKGKNKDRVGKIKLRGEPSFGLVVEIPEGQSWEVGKNVAEFFGCKKYIPPIRTTEGDAAKYDERIDPLISRYTDIENGRIYTNIFKEGEEVVITEKIHGTNGKLGIIKDVGFFAGSMSIRRKHPQKPTWIPKTWFGRLWVKLFGMRFTDAEWNDKEMFASTYWFPWTISGVRTLMGDLSQDHNIITLYGEIYGVQSLKYGITSGFGFKAFDLNIDGKYLNWDDFKYICDKHKVPIVPILYRGAFDIDKVKGFAEGKTTIEGANHIREGVVVKPVIERVHPEIGRTILKYIGTEYELSKHKEKDTTDQ